MKNFELSNPDSQTNTPSRAIRRGETMVTAALLTIGVGACNPADKLPSDEQSSPRVSIEKLLASNPEAQRIHDHALETLEDLTLTDIVKCSGFQATGTGPMVDNGGKLWPTAEIEMTLQPGDKRDDPALTGAQVGKYRTEIKWHSPKLTTMHDLGKKDYEKSVPGTINPIVYDSASDLENKLKIDPTDSLFRGGVGDIRAAEHIRALVPMNPQFEGKRTVNVDIGVANPLGKSQVSLNERFGEVADQHTKEIADNNCGTFSVVIDKNGKAKLLKPEAAS